MIKLSVIYSGLLFSTSGVVVSGSGVMTGERDHLFNFLKLDHENNDRYANWAALASEKSDELKRSSSRDYGDDNQLRKKSRKAISDSSDKKEDFLPIQSSEDTTFENKSPTSSSSSSSAPWNSYGRLGKLRAHAEALATSPSSIVSEAAKPIITAAERKRRRNIFDSILKRYSKTEANNMRSLYEKYTKDLEQEYPELRPMKFNSFRIKALRILRRDETQNGQVLRNYVFVTPRLKEIIESVCCEYGKDQQHSFAELYRIAVQRFQENALDPISFSTFFKEYKEILKNQKCLVDAWPEDEIAWFTSMFLEDEEA